MTAPTAEPAAGTTRRNALKLAGAAAALPLVHIRTAGAAGRLSIGFWDHWVPAGNEVMTRQVNAWAEKNKVEVHADYITTVGNKLLLTTAAEELARSGHDVLTFLQWDVQNHYRGLEPVDDVVSDLASRYGQPNEICGYLGKVGGHWLGVPSSSGAQNKGPCGRISTLRDAAGIDIVKMYPARDEHTPESDAWTYDTMLKAAEACKKVGMTFGIGIGTTGDSVDTAGSLFKAFGAELVDAEGNIQVKSDAVRQALEYGQKLVRFLPDDAVSYDDASNNKALISGKSALIWNPPSAWAVAKRDAPAVAADSWTFPAPLGPKGRFMPYVPFFWGIWQFSPNKTAAKELITFLCERKQVEERCAVVQGYDLPPFESMADFPIWSEVEPPKGTVFNYPIRKSSGQRPHIAAFPAPPEIAVQIYNRGTMPTMLAKLQSGQSINQVIAWAQDELEGFAH
jgi:ABC-type glycerol-3-phosphate transport system substrate-binding protein